MKTLVFCLVGTILLCFIGNHGALCVDIKPGVCPDTGMRIGLCAEFCSNDQDCPGDQKCCSNGCGHSCTAPYTVKPGVCPSVGMRIGLCAEFCSNDQDCPGDQKCCSNGCGHSCTAPYTVTVKPGVCPRRKSLGRGVCAEYCSNDQECPRNQKCCSNGCGHVCSPPKAQPVIS